MKGDDFVGLLTWDKIEGVDKKLESIEKHLVNLEMKIDIVSKGNNSIENIEANIAEIKNQIFELKK